MLLLNKTKTFGKTAKLNFSIGFGGFGLAAAVITEFPNETPIPHFKALIGLKLLCFDFQLLFEKCCCPPIDEKARREAYEKFLDEMIRQGNIKIDPMQVN